MSKARKVEPIPIIDLFAGPGGLGEGFSQFGEEGESQFEIKLSVEMNSFAHRTLLLRAFFRQLHTKKSLDLYYDYIRGGNTSIKDLEKSCPDEMAKAKEEALCRTLGDEATEREIKKLITSRVQGKDWVLIGGPPCQAYSSVGRARMLGLPRKEDETDSDYKKRLNQRRKKFEKDHRHFLYREYLKIIADHWPTVFVMENVKGILSARIKGKRIFPEILSDLKKPATALGREGDAYTYTLCSLVVPASDDLDEIDPSDLLIRAENYGVPQARHRVIILGIRNEKESGKPRRLPMTLTPETAPTVKETIGNLPPLAPSISPKHHSDLPSTRDLISDLKWTQEIESPKEAPSVIDSIHASRFHLWEIAKRGGQYVPDKTTFPRGFPLRNWFHDPALGGICNHETRGHMPEDLRRYFYCACFAEARKHSPKLKDFPRILLPNHENVRDDSTSSGQQKFADRFRVQLADRASSTIMSHIANDGHYYIHYDPKQARSLTVREAARLQTFPDNYFFEGPRTQQYRQVGNAVPPYLAFQIAEVVSDLMN